MENPKTNLPNDEAPVILHADDDPVEREIIQRILKQGRVPARLCSVQDGQQAMDYLAGQGEYADRARFPLPDLILLDLKMPRKTGFDVLEWRRTQAACARVPVIVVTTLREDREVARAFQLGANSYLVKPVLAETLQDLYSAFVLPFRQPVRVLLIDDNPDDRAMAENQLRREFPTAQITAAHLPEDIARVLERGEFDLVISDFNAPWWTGIENLRAVKVRYPERPVIIYTGSATPENLIQALEAGLDDYVLKSSDIDRARLPNAVRIAIGRAWQRRALRESEERFRTMSDFTYDWEYWVGTDGNYVYMSPSCERITGYRAEELASNPHLLEAIVHPGDLATLTQHLRERSDSDEMATLDFRIIRRDGQVRWINHICRKVHSADGRWLGRRASNRDITERKRAEEALRESEERFRALIENATDLVIVLNPDGTGRYVSPSVERILGYPPEELVGTRIADFIHPDDLPAALQAIAYRAQTPGLAGQSSEFRVRHKDGSDRTMEVIGNNLLDDPAVNGIVVNARDITERRRAEESLRESEEKYRSLFANSLDAVLLTMPDGRILAANDAACRMFGSTEQELRQLGRGGVVDTSDPRLAAGLEERARTGKFSGELTLVRKDGTKFPSEMSTAIYMDQTGQKKTSMIIRDITERKRAEEELEHRAEQFALLYDAGLTLNRTLDPRVQLEFLFKIAVKALHADRAEFFRYDPARDALRFEQSIGYAEKGEAEQALRAQSFRNGDERGLVGWVSQNRVPLNVPDVSADPRYIAIDSEIRSGLWVPVERENRLGGVLAVLSARVGAFTPQDERLLALFANQVAVALENARLFEETSRRLKQVQALHAIDVAIGSSLDLRVTLNVFLEQVTALLGIHAAETLLLNPHTHILEYASARGFRTKALQQTHLRLGDGYAGRAALERRTISIANLAEPENRFGRSPLFADEGFVAYYAVPLIAKGYVRGVLELFHRAPFEPDQEWLDFLQTLAGQAAIAIDNASLFDDLQRSNIELGLAYDTTIEGWSRALDLRDKETEGHTQRVTEITMRLARAMGIDDNELVQVRRGALLHDIGKMGVPDSILLKPDKLDDDEWKVMWLHPKLAYDMLSPITYLRPALDIPYCHHEKWDGTGYPRGLKGEQIPLAARVFAIVDVWDALRSDRPYRKAWARDTALEHIRGLAGTHFDPKVVEEFLKVDL